MNENKKPDVCEISTELDKKPVTVPVKISEVKKDSGKISYEDFAKIEIKAGKILSAEKIPDTDKLLKLLVDFAESVESVDEAGNKTITPKPRQIVSGISTYFPDPAVLIGKTCMFVTNLEPRMIKGYESNGMLFALSTPTTPEIPTGNFSLLEPNSTIPAGTKAK